MTTDVDINEHEYTAERVQQMGIESCVNTYTGQEQSRRARKEAASVLRQTRSNETRSVAAMNAMTHKA